MLKFVFTHVIAWFTGDYSKRSYRNERSFYEDFKRIAAHVAMSIQKGKHQTGQTQGYPQRYPHAASYPFMC